MLKEILWQQKFGKIVDLIQHEKYFFNVVFARANMEFL